MRVTLLQLDVELGEFVRAMKSDAFWIMTDNNREIIIDSLSKLYLSVSGSEAEIVRASLNFNACMEEFFRREQIFDGVMHVTGTLS
jgi:hypothetical protein